MAEWYANRLRDEAGAAEAQIDALEKVRETWHVLFAHAETDDLRDLAAEEMDKLDDQIGSLERRVDDLDDDIHFADPERL